MTSDVPPTVVAPHVVGVDRIEGTSRILINDAARPELSADGNHLVYQRGDSVRMLSSRVDSVVDAELAELATARPTSPISISQHGRWLAFASAADLSQESAADGDAPGVSALWAADRMSSLTELVDTAGGPVIMPRFAEPTPSIPPTTVAPPSTVPIVTNPPTPITPRFPSSTRRPGSSSSSSTGSSSETTTAEADPVSFEPTTIASIRRQPVTLVNTTTETLEVSALSVTPPGVFSVVSDDCTGARACSRSNL